MSSSSNKKWMTGVGVLLGLTTMGALAGMLYVVLYHKEEPLRRSIKKKTKSKQETEEESSTKSNTESTLKERKREGSCESVWSSDTEREEDKENCSSDSEYCTAKESEDETEPSSSDTENFEVKDGLCESDKVSEKKRRKRRNHRQKMENTNAEENEKLFSEADNLMKGNDDERLEAYDLLRKHENELSLHSDFLWRYARAHQIQAVFHRVRMDPKSKEKFINEGLEHARKAVEIDPNNGDAHKWLAILIGMYSELDSVSTADKIKSAAGFQEHLLKAITLKPEDYSLHYLLGRFKFELASISWFERKMAGAIFGEIPHFTYTEAIEDCRVAEELSPTPWKENKVLLAKCHIKTEEYTTAVEFLESAKKIPPRTMEDRACDEEIQQLLVKYKRYSR